MEKDTKKNLWKKRMKFRELTKNEKILLSLLGIVIVIWGSLRFIITPQKDKLARLSEEKTNYQKQINEINSILKKESSIHEEWETLHREKEEIVSQYFPKLDQAQIIYLLNKLIEHEDLSIVDLNFARPSYEDLGGFQVKNMEISLPYNGGYGGIIDVVNAIKKSPRKLLIDSLSMDRSSNESLNGNMSLKIYSLEGIVESDNNDIIYIDTTLGERKETPFAKYDEYSMVENQELEDDYIDRDLGQDKTYVGEGVSQYIEEILLDFESKNNYFLPSQPLVKGNVMQSTNSKSKRYSLRFEYDILAVEEENRAYVDISRNNITLKYPPNTIGMWVYSYDYSPVTLGIGFKGQMGEEEFLALTEGIGWTGWKYLELSPPRDLSIYPLKLDKLYLEMPKNREDYGVILMDKLQAVYTRNLAEDGSDESRRDYIFHLVSRGETIEGISMTYYGSKSFKNEILKLNEMKAGDILTVGKVLVLKKR